MKDSLPLYYEKPWLLEVEARVLATSEENGMTSIVLDRTPFYPEGGGQPSDLGDIAGHKLEQVSEKDGSILHWIAGKPGIGAGDVAICRVDADRRRSHTQQHSGQHLLSAVLEREYSLHTIGFHLGENYCTIDISAPEFTRDTFMRVEELVEKRIANPLPINVHVCPPEDPALFPLRKKLPEGELSLRIVEIGGYDWVPCCGTHLNSTAELRMVKILSAEKYKAATRLYFVSGDHAVKVMAQRYAVLASAALAAGCSQEDVPARIIQQKNKLDAIEAERAELLKARAVLELGNTGGEGNILAISFATRKIDAIQESVKAALAHNSAVIALSNLDKTVLAATSPSLQNAKILNLSGLLKPLLATYGGSGGGGAGSFRATFKEETVCQLFFEASLKAMSYPGALIRRIEL